MCFMILIPLQLNILHTMSCILCILKVAEEEEAKHKGKDIATGSIELLSHVQKSEDELKVSENKRWELILGLQIKLKEEVEQVRQQMTNLEERLLTVQRTGVRNILCLMHLHSNHLVSEICPKVILSLSLSACCANRVGHHNDRF